MKNLCSNIYVMMSNYAKDKPSEGSSSVLPTSRTAVEPLDLLPLKRLTEECVAGAGGNQLETPEPEGISPRLFGVAIGVKRLRDGGSGETREQCSVLQLQQPGVNVKLEPLDRNGSGGSVDDQTV
ncbi:hypothetical protein R6Q59_014207 [Mikania micrantha]